MAKASRRHEVCNEYARTLIRVKARQMIHRPGFNRSEQEDIEQDLFAHLLSQADRFDPARGALNTFIARVVNSAVAMTIRERRRDKRASSGRVVIQSLEVRVEQPDGPPIPLWATISVADLLRRTGGAALSDAEFFELVEGVASVVALLPPELREVCQSLMGEFRSTTAKELGFSRRSFEAAMDMIRQHFARGGFGKI